MFLMVCYTCTCFKNTNSILGTASTYFKTHPSLNFRGQCNLTAQDPRAILQRLAFVVFKHDCSMAILCHCILVWSRESSAHYATRGMCPIRALLCFVGVFLRCFDFMLLHILRTMSQSYVWGSNFLSPLCWVCVLHHMIVRESTCHWDTDKWVLCLHGYCSFQTSYLKYMGSAQRGFAPYKWGVKTSRTMFFGDSDSNSTFCIWSLSEQPHIKLLPI